MTKDEIDNGNKLIQQWLYENNGIGYWSNEPLNFNNDYGWIMPVVEKIENQTNAVFQIYKRSIICIYDYNEWQGFEKTRLDLISEHKYNRTEFRDEEWIPFQKLDTIWIAVVGFIKWHNSQLNKRIKGNDKGRN